MPRLARVVMTGSPHHVTQRGNNAQDVFFVDDDRRAYLAFLQAQSARFGLSLDAYCLMGNHVHLVAVPRRPDSLARAIGRTNWLYSQYVNRLHGRSGHLWQNRFYSCPMDELHYWTAVCYVERNPVRAGLARMPWRYPWSSAAAHCGEAGPDGLPGLLDLERWRSMTGGRDWRDSLRQGLADREEKELRRCTLTGRPLGTDSFLSKLETVLGRRLRAMPVGRPRKRKTSKGDPRE
jgi:putative transposase